MKCGTSVVGWKDLVIVLAFHGRPGMSRRTRFHFIFDYRMSVCVFRGVCCLVFISEKLKKTSERKKKVQTSGNVWEKFQLHLQRRSKKKMKNK